MMIVYETAGAESHKGWRNELTGETLYRRSSMAYSQIIYYWTNTGNRLPGDDGVTDKPRR